MTEIWKDIPNYEGLYQASNFGQIRSHPNKKTYTKKHGVRKWKSRILKPKGCKNYNLTGYRVSLWKNNKSKDFLVARLVATTFLENLIDTKMTVNHKDGNRLNNTIDNLEWLTLGDNIRHGFETGLYNCRKKVVLTNVETKEQINFKSLKEASLFLHKNQGYLSNVIKRNNEFATSENGMKYYYELQ